MNENLTLALYIQLLYLHQDSSVFSIESAGRKTCDNRQLKNGKCCFELLDCNIILVFITLYCYIIYLVEKCIHLFYCLNIHEQMRKKSQNN